MIGLHAGIVLAHRTRGIAPKRRITGISSGSGQNHTLRALTDGVFIASDVIRTFIITRTIYGNTDVVLTDIVLGRRAAIQNRTAFVFPFALNGNALIVVITGKMLFAADIIRAGIGTGTIHRYALVLSIAFHVRSAITSERDITFIGAGSCGHKTCCATVCSTFRMTFTRNLIRTLIGTRSIHRDAFILIRAFGMLHAASKNGIAFICASTGNRDACGIVIGTFRMHCTRYHS